MVQGEAYPQSFLHNQQWGQNPQAWGQVNPQIAQALGQAFGSMGQQSGNYGLGQAAFGQGSIHGTQFGQGGIGPWGQPQGWGGAWQRQLSQQDVGEVVRQLLPLLPQVLAQAQQPQAAYGYGGFSQGQFGHQYGQGQRQLTQQDVNEVVRQILPIVPQIVSLLQGQGGPHAAALHSGGGYGWGAQSGQSGGFGGGFGQGQGQNPYAQNLLNQLLQQQSYGQFGGGIPPFQAAFGGSQSWGQQRQLSQADVGEVARQLASVIPQVIANLQAFNQQQQRPM